MKRLFLIPYGQPNEANKSFSQEEVLRLKLLQDNLVRAHADELTMIIVSDETARGKHVQSFLAHHFAHARTPGMRSGYVVDRDAPEKSQIPIKDLATQTTNLVVITDSSAIERLTNMFKAEVALTSRVDTLLPRLSLGKALCIDRNHDAPRVI